jgi:hypothetical protein
LGDRRAYRGGADLMPLRLVVHTGSSGILVELMPVVFLR